MSNITNKQTKKTVVLYAIIIDQAAPFAEAQRPLARHTHEQRESHAAVTCSNKRTRAITTGDCTRSENGNLTFAPVRPLAQ